jgi:hypothetical protein
MIDFFNKRILYFTTWPDSFGDGINNIKHMYYVLSENKFRTLFHANLNTNTIRNIWWMLHKDNLIDRIYSHPEHLDFVNYLEVFDYNDYDEVYFRDIYVKNHADVHNYFLNKSKCYSLGHHESTKMSSNFDSILQNKPVFDYFKCTFENQKREIFKNIFTEKIAILMPFSTRNYAILREECILNICNILIENGYSVLLCGEYPIPYNHGIDTIYDKQVKLTLDLLRNRGSDKIINLLGMSASKVASLSENCNVILYASTGAVQMSYYNYTKCPWVILENGREDMMNSLSRIFSNDPIKIVDVKCDYKYCQQYLQETNINNIPEKVLTCKNTYSKCIGEEFNYDGLINIIKKL